MNTCDLHCASLFEYFININMLTFFYPSFQTIFMSASRTTTSGMKRKSTTTVDELKQNSENDVAEGILYLEKQLIHELTNSNITYESSIEYIYNPLDYAFELHSKYVHKYGNSKKKLLFLGMNPGPWGMVQCGVRVISSFVEG